MKKGLLIILFWQIITAVTAQNLTFDWGKRIGGSGDDEGSAITVDADGNVYTTGIFQSTIDFDPGTGIYNLSSVGNYDVYVQKLDADGNLIWAKSFGGTGEDKGQGIAIDASGNIYIVGHYMGTVDFDPGSGIHNITTAGDYDIFIEKLDSEGNFVWAKSFGGTGWDLGEAISIDNIGNVYAIGEFVGVVDFNPNAGTYNLTSAGGDDIFIVKLDSDGNFVWADGTGGTGSDYGLSIQVSSNGNVFSTGWYSGTADFDPGVGTSNLTSNGNTDIFVQKLTSDGTFVYAKSTGGTSDDVAYSLFVDESENTYVTGYFKETADFNPNGATYNLSSTGGKDIFIQKLNSSGSFVWAKAMGGTQDDYGRSIRVDSDGNVYTSGSFKGTADFNPGTATNNLISAGESDLFVQKLYSYGSLDWVIQSGGTGYEGTFALALDPENVLYYTGYFQNTVDFNPGSETNNLTYDDVLDVFIVKLKQCTNTNSDINESTCNTYTSPSGNYTWMTSGTYYDTIPNTTGCDSIITVYLTVNSNTTGVDTQTACDSYTWIDGNSYTESNTSATYTLTNFAGCDSLVTLDLTIETIDTTVTQNSDTLIANQTGATYQWVDCNNANAPISGATNQIFIAQENGNYAVEVSNGSCTKLSECHIINDVSINTINPININIYPNPAKRFVNICIPNLISTNKILIFDVTGQEVFENKTTSNNTLIDISKFQTGTYFVRIISTENTITKKLIIK